MKESVIIEIVGALLMIILVLTIVGVIPFVIGVSVVTLFFFSLVICAVTELTHIRELLQELLDKQKSKENTK